MDLRIIEDERRGVETEVAQVAMLLTEDQPPHGRVNPVGSDEQVGIQRATVAQRDSHAVGGVVDGVEAGSEAQVDVAGQLLAQRLFQIRSQDAEQPVLHDLAELLEPEPGAAASRLVKPAGLLEPVSQLLQSGQQSHDLGGVISRPKEVDHVTLRSRAGCLFQHHHFPAESVESLGQCEPGDPGSTNDNFHPRGPSLLRWPARPACVVYRQLTRTLSSIKPLRRGCL